MDLLFSGEHFDAAEMERNKFRRLTCHAPREQVWKERRMSEWEYCAVFGIGIGRSIQSQKEEKLKSRGSCRNKAGSV